MSDTRRNDQSRCCLSNNCFPFGHQMQMQISSEETNVRRKLSRSTNDANHLISMRYSSSLYWLTITQSSSLTHKVVQNVSSSIQQCLFRCRLELTPYTANSTALLAPLYTLAGRPTQARGAVPVPESPSQTYTGCSTRRDQREARSQCNLPPSRQQLRQAVSSL